MIFESNSVENDAEIPDSFEIGWHCFSGSGITAIELPRNTTVIDDYAFASCRFTEITLPAPIRYLGKDMFSSSMVKNITILADKVPEIGGNLWYSNSEANAVTIHVPAKLIDEYKSADVWKNYKYVTLETLVESITLSETSVTIDEGETCQLTATVLPADADNRAVEWKSDNESVATVNADGVVTAVSAGTATITVSTLDGSDLTATCVVTVVRPVVMVTELRLDITAITLKEGETCQLTAMVLPADADNRAVEWKSDNENVATVNADGVVTAVSAGTATITVSTLDGSDVTATCLITVLSPTVGLDIATAGEIDVKVESGAIVVTGTSEEVSVYNVNGLLIRKTMEHRIDNLASGYYIVCVAGRYFKIML